MEIELLKPGDFYAGRLQQIVIALSVEGRLETLLLENPIRAATDMRTTFQVVHAAHALPEVDVYALSGDQTLEDSLPLGRLVFREVFSPIELPAGDYQILITKAGVKEALFGLEAMQLDDGAAGVYALTGHLLSSRPLLVDLSRPSAKPVTDDAYASLTH